MEKTQAMNMAQVVQLLNTMEAGTVVNIMIEEGEDDGSAENRTETDRTGGDV